MEKKCKKEIDVAHDFNLDSTVIMIKDQLFYADQAAINAEEVKSKKKRKLNKKYN